jgi:DNA-binding response OmpR family regulator
MALKEKPDMTRLEAGLPAEDGFEVQERPRPRHRRDVLLQA